MKINELIKAVDNGSAEESLLGIYSENNIEKQKKRWLKLLRRHLELFGDRDAMVISAPGRTELGGNHTDHNHGNVIAGSVELDSLCVISKADNSLVTLDSEGYKQIRLDVTELAVKPEEKDTTKALLRGILFRFKDLGYRIGAFNCNMDSEVLPGSGLSSSASVEVLIGTALSEFFNDGDTGFVEVSQIGQYAENNYFGKACGLMDQVACAAGGVVGIDFKDPAFPIIEPVSYSFSEKGYKLMVTDVRSSHANLSDEYSLMPKEMRCVAELLDAQVCRDITFQQLKDNIADIRKKCGDRAALRAFHFLNEDRRAVAQIKALEADDFKEYLRLVNESGNSSYKYLQNVYLGMHPAQQAISIGLAFTEQFLNSCRPDEAGACRIQGGGFAGTIQAYIHEDKTAEYISYMEDVFGEGC